jgi:hypothetical protein
LQCDEECGVGVRIAYADVAEGVEDVVVGEDVVCCYERGKERCDVPHFVLPKSRCMCGTKSSKLIESGRMSKGLHDLLGGCKVHINKSSGDHRPTGKHHNYESVRQGSPDFSP